MARNKREELYLNLINSGKVSVNEIGTQQDFLNAIKDERTARQLHANLIGSGLLTEQEIGSVDDFYGSISSDFAESEPIQPAQQPSTYSTQDFTISESEMEGKKNGTEKRAAQQPTAKFPTAAEMMEERRKKFELPPLFRKEVGMDEEGNRVTRPKVENVHVPGTPAPQVSPVYRDMLGNEYDVTDPNVQAEAERQTHAQQIDLAKANREQVADLSKHLDYLYEEAVKKASEGYAQKQKKEREEHPIAWAMAHSSPSYVNGYRNETNDAIMNNPAVKDIEAARRAMRNAQRIIKEADIAVQEDATHGNLRRGTVDFAKGVGRGFGDKLFDIDTWDMGISDVNDAASLMSALNAFDKGQPLTESQQALLDAKSIELATNAYFGSYVGGGYKAGGVTAESLPFMLEMMINPASGTGHAAQNAMVRYAIKRFGKQALKKNAKKYLATKVATRLGGDVGASLVLTGTTGSLEVAADAANRMNGDLHYDTNDEGQSVFAGHDNQKEFTTALRQAFVSRTIENHSEMVGEYFSPLFGAVGRGLRKGLGKIGLDKVNKFVDDVAASDIAKLVTDFEKSAKWNGTIGEYAEEIVGGVENALLVGDQTLDTDPETGVFNLDNNIDTFRGVAIFGGVISTIKTAGYRTPKYRARKNVTKADNQAVQVFGNQETWDAIKNTLAVGDDADVKAKVKEVLETNEYSQEQKLAVLQYLKASDTYKGVLKAEQKRREEQDPVQTDLETSFDNGYTLEGQDMNDAKNNLDYQRQRVAEIGGEETAKKLEEDPIAALWEIEKNDAWTPEQRQVALDYANAKATYDGMIQHVQDDIDSRIAESDILVNGRINKGDGMIHSATLTTDRKVYIVGGQVLMSEDGSGIDRAGSIEANGGDGMILVTDGESGKVETASVEDFLSVDAPLDAEEERRTAQETIRQQYAQQAADEIEGVLPFNDNDVYNVLDEEGQEHTIQVVPAGDAAAQMPTDNGQVLVSVDGAYVPQVMTREEVQKMADAYNLARLAKHEQEKETKRIEEKEEAEGQESAGEATGTTAAESTETDDAMPMIGEGEDAEPDFLATTPERGHAYIYNEAGLSRDEANQFVEANKKAADKALEKAKNTKPKMGTSLAKYRKEQTEYQQKVDAAQKVADYWKKVKDAQQLVLSAEQEERAKQNEAVHEQAVIEEQARQAEELRKREEQAALGTNNVAPAIREKWEAAPKVEGARNEIVLANGEHVPGRYVLVESGAATPSHNPRAEFVKNEGFPQDENGQSVNDRDYERDKDAQSTTRQIASIYDQRALQTPVVVTNDGIVLSGNGRTMAGELAAQDNTDGAYIEHLKQYGSQFGFAPEQVEGMQHPRVVFVPDEAMPYTADTFAKFNQQEMKGQNKTEQAVKLGKIVGDNTFSRIIRSINGYNTLGEYYADTQATTQAINELRDAGAISQAQYGEMFDGETISAQGREMLENMLIGKAFESNPDAVRQITAFKGVRQGIITALAEISNNIMLGDEYSHEADLAQAINLVYQARNAGYKAGEKVSNFARQLNLFPFDEGATVADADNATVLMFADLLNEGKPTLLKKALALYNQAAKDSANGQLDIFSGDVRSKEEILDEVRQLLKYGTEEQQQAALDAATAERVAASQPIVQEDGTTGTSNQDGETAGSTGVEAESPFAAAEREVNTNPTEAQKEAGNYKKGHVKIDGYDVTIENPKGSERSGTDASGKQWRQTMHNTYGYIRGTEGVDGDHIDVFLSDAPESGNVYVIDQRNADGTFDEHKVMYGFNSAEEARDAYLSNYEEGWQGLGTITEVSKDEFKKWIDSSHRKTKPFADYKSVKPIGAQNEAIQPTGRSVLGNLFNQFKGKAKEAIDFLLQRKEGDAVAALHHKDVGDIDLWYGNDKAGLKKIAEKHPDVLDNLQDKINEMKVIKASDNRIILESATHKAVVSKMLGDEKTDNWLLSAYEKKGTSASSSDNETEPEGKRIDTASPQNSLSDGKGTEKSDTVQENQGKSSYSITPKDYTTKRGKVLNMHLVKFGNELDKETLRKAKTLAKKWAGWWSREDGGFLMRDEMAAETFANTVLDAEALEDEQPLSLQDMAAATEQLPTEQDTNDGDRALELFNSINEGDVLVNDTGMTATILKKANGGNATNQAISVKWEQSVENGTNGHAQKIMNAANFLKWYEANKMRKQEENPNANYKVGDTVIFLNSNKTARLKGKIVRVDKTESFGTEYEVESIIVTDNGPGKGVTSRPHTYTILEGQIESKVAAQPQQTEAKQDVSDSVSDSVSKTNQAEPKRLVSDERMEELKARLRKKMFGQLNMVMGVDPEILAIGAELAVGHIERGLTKFSDYAKTMIEDLGDAIRPYLKAFYNAVRDMPEAEEYAEKMDSYDDVRKFDLLSVRPEGETSDTTAGILERAEEVAKEQEAEEQAEVAKGKLTEQRNYGRKVQSEGVALDGTPLRTITEKDLDNRDAKFYHQGKRVYIFAVMRSGEQVSATQFSEPHLDNIYLTNGQSIKPEELMVADETKEPVDNNSVQKILDIAKKGKKPSKSKKKDVTLQSPSFMGDLFNENTEDNGHERTDAARTEGLSADGTDSGERSLRANGQEVGQESGRTDRRRAQGGVESVRHRLHDGLRPSDQLTNTPTGQRRTRQPLERPANPKNLRNNHAERGKNYAPKGVDARIDANIKAIELMKQLMESGEQATPEQMAVLRQFSGWGGLGKAFENFTAYTNGKPTPQYLRELLGEEAYQQANMSRNSAYYTPANVIDAMWDVAKAMGFQGGNVLEGSAGIGDIIGHMPSDMSERSNIRAVEIDQTTGNILSLLYPDAKVDVQGFEATQVENGSIDLAITNVPFVTGLRVNDTTGDKDLSKKFHDIHDFCIAKNVRKLREGGIGIFITSSGTLDNSAKLREWIIQEGGADVVGAFRMHNETFGGTGATSDIIVIRKRVNGMNSTHAIDVLSTTGERTADYDTGDTKRVKGQEIPIIKHLSMDYNSYFVEHPEMMAGEMHFGFEKGETFRPTSKALYPSKDKNQDEMLKAWAESFAEKEWESYSVPNGALPDGAVDVYEDLGEGVKEGSIVVSNGQLCIAQRGKAVPLAVNANKVKGKTKVQCFEAYQGIKKALADLLQYQTENEDDAGLKPLLQALNKAYDSFVKTYGHLHKNTAISFLKNDVDFANIVALESFTELGDGKGGVTREYGKTDIFSQRVVDKEKAPEPKDVKDGIIASIYVHGRIDLPWIVDKLNAVNGQHTEESVKAEIIASGLGFENPATRQMEVSYEYLSGNVREKLAQAQANNSDGQYDANIKALEAVIPMNIPAHLIDFSIGSSWIDPKLYEEYVKEKTDIDVKFTTAGGTWFMKTPYYVAEQKNRAMGVVSEMLHKTIMGTQLIEAAMQNKTITVSETHKKWDGSTETITDKEATQACSNKIDEIRQDFKDWARAKMQSDPTMSEHIERIYNEMFNNYVPKSIPDEFVPAHFGGAATMVDGKEFALRPHQAKAAIRGTTQPLLLAHEVGSGKTYTLITTAMEMRRLGIARKPMAVVQNATVGQFVESAKKLYPNAKVLTIEEADRTAEGRKNFYAKIKYNDWDMIVVPQSVFERIPDSEERQMKFVQDKIEEKLLVLEQMKDSDPQGQSMIVRQAEKEIESLKDELAGLTDTISTKRKERDEKKRAVTMQNAEVKALEMLDRQTDDVENFDDMGIDAILVDEAHEYKHLGFATAMQRGVKGVDPSYSKKAQGVYLKTQAVLEKNNGRNVIFATGTPISNTAAEIWTFMRYLMPSDTMKEYGIFYFDDFVRNFGNLTQMLEFTTSGKFKENNRFAGYINLPELVRIWAGVADTVLNKDIEAQRIAEGKESKIPDMEDGKATDIYLPQTRALRSIMKFVKKRLDEYEKMSGKEKKENSHIPLTMYGIAKAAAVDARLVMSDATDEPQSKTNEAVRQILKSLSETDSYKGTVAVFADNYQNKKSGFNLYDDIREKLIAQGVPAEQIVVMKRGMSVKKKLEIFDKVNRGEVRVIMGSTFTLGTGVNIQERLHTLIHLDAPNRPMDYTQRNGRILRQGNLHKDMNKPVRVLRFGVEDSLDVTAYQRLKTKGAIADSIMNGKQMMANSMENRALEEEEDVFGDTVAQLSGSEYAMLKNQAEKDVRKYEAKKKQYEADQTYCHNEIPRLEGEIKTRKEWLEKNRTNLATTESLPTEKTITVGKQTFASIDAMADFIKEYNKTIKEVENDLRDNPSLHSETRRLTVNVGGIDFVFTTEQSIETKQDQGTLFSAVRRKMTYSCEAFGLKDVPVRQSLLREGLEDIVKNVVSGKDFREFIERGERNLDRCEKSLAQIRERFGKPFEYSKELATAHERLDEYAELMKKELEEKEKKYAEMDADVDEATNITEAEEAEEDDNEDEDSKLYRMREEEPPVRTGIGYKVFVLKDGKLYPPMVANPNGEDTPVGAWLNADAAPIAGTSKTGRAQVKAGGKGTQGGSGTLAYRPGWHLGVIPYALQFNRKNPKTGEKELFPANFVWAEVEYSNDVDYQQEAYEAGVNENGKYQHALAGLKRVPENGSYTYRTNPNPETDPWIITGAMKVRRILKPSEVDELVKAAGREPQPREAGAVTDEQVEALNKEIMAKDIQKRFDELNEKYNGKPYSILKFSEIPDVDFARAIGVPKENIESISPEELHEEVQKLKDDAIRRKSMGGYSPSNRKIAIFAENIPLHKVEEFFFHENIHGILHDLYEDGERGVAERFFDIAPSQGGLVEWSFIENGYKDKSESQKEEFFVYSLSRAMVQGRVSEILDMLSQEDSERTENILNIIGYDRRTEEANRRAEAEKQAKGSLGQNVSPYSLPGGAEGNRAQDEAQRSLGRHDQGLLLGREGQNGVSYEESLASSRTAGYTKKQQEAYRLRQNRQKRNAAEDAVSKLGLGDRVTIVDSADGIGTNVTERKRRAKGWYDRKTGNIVIVLGNHGSTSDVIKTVLHEGVAHFGLRQLFGKHFDQFLDNVYQYADTAVRSNIVELAKKHNWDFRTATEEYLASLAEDTNFENADKQGWWSRIKSLFLDMLRTIGLAEYGGAALTDNELRYILWRSYQNLAHPGMYRSIIGQAEDVAKQYELGMVKRGKPYVYDAEAEPQPTEKSAGSSGENDDVKQKVIDAFKKKYPDESTIALVLKGDRYYPSDSKAFVDIAGQASIPKSKLDLYLPRLVRAGKRVAIIDDPAPFAKAAEKGIELFRDGDETKGIWADKTLGLQEQMTETAARLANENSEDKVLRGEAMRAIGANLSDLRKAMSLQRHYDRLTVKRVADLSRILIDGGYLNDLSKQEVKRLLSALKNSTGREEIDSSVQKVMDIMVDNQLKHAEETLHQLETIKGSKVDARGVEVQGELDPTGQQIIKVFKKMRGEDKENINNALSEAQERMGSEDAAIAETAALEYAGLQFALEYAENIKASKAEERELRKELENRHAETSHDYHLTDEYKEYKKSVEDAIRQNKAERVQAYYDLVSKLSGNMRESMANAAAFKEAEKQRVREIQHNANSDMEGRPSNEHYKPKFLDKFVNNPFVRFFFAPLATFDQFLRLLGSKSANGEGYLYNRFMRGWVDARQKEISGVRGKYAILDAKASELFGSKVKTWGDLIRNVGKMPKASVSFWDGGEMREHELTQGNLLYIYMVNKMLDGRMKLRKMGITEEDVANIENVLDPRLIKLAEWLQEEFLVGTRNEYNETHKRMFGAPMAAVEHYFPLKILANARADKPEDLDNPEMNEGISTATGSIIKRRRNALALDITGADALNVILDHVTQMEHWNAFAEFNRDLNTLRTYKRFRNQVQNMTSVYGSGTKLWQTFNDLCQMAAGTYRPKRATLDETAVNLAKGVTAAKVSFRLFTALKQLLSAPAYISEARPDYLVKNIMTSWKACNWSMEHLPIFNERLKSRIAGDPRLMKTELDWAGWRNNVVQIASRIGMSPNAFIDAWTVSVGAYSIYETKKSLYKSYGYSEEQAEKKAIQDAEIAYNQTQQSSEGAFLSTMQVDRSWLTVLFTIFRNASMAYQRQLHDAIRNIKRDLTPGQREKSIAFMAKQFVRDGIDEEQSIKNAESRFNRQFGKDAVRVAVFGFVMQLCWNMGSYLPYLLFGDDDDEKDKMWDDILAKTYFGSIEGFTGGDVLSQAGQMLVTGEGNPTWLSKDMPLTGDMLEVLKELGSGKTSEALTDIVNLIVQAGIGVNPQSITDAVLAVMDVCNGDAHLAHEATIFAARIMQVPQSQIDKLYFDDVKLSGKEAKGMTFDQLVKRYAEYKVKRENFFSPWAWDDEERLEKKSEKTYEQIKERLENMSDEDADNAMERNYSGDGAGVSEATRKAIGEAKAKRLGGTDYYYQHRNDSEHAKAYAMYRDYFDMAGDVLLQVALKEAEEAKDEKRAYGIKSAREDMNGWKPLLVDGKHDPHEVMEKIRKIRNEALEKYGKK